MRFKLTLEYDGRAFLGWQRVAQGASVQGALEEAIFKLSGARVEVIGAGRTDSGVHARGQVAHFDLETRLAPGRVRDGLNAHLRPDLISVLACEEAAPDFHARFDAVKRSYQYRVIPRRAPLALESGRAWRVPRELHIGAMNAAAQRLVGRHDFTTFRDAGCQAKSPVKTLDIFEVSGFDDDVYFWCEARSFLHRQVRSMVGTLVEVGLGKLSADDVAAALAAKDRARCGPVAPSDGLYLMRVDY